MAVNSENILKIIISILLLMCLLKMPYWYYELLRFSAFMIFGFLAIKSHDRKNELSTFIYVALALLFQPFFKIALTRVIWNSIDVVVAFSVIISVIYKRK